MALNQMDNVISSLNGETEPEVISSELSTIVDEIFKNGLTEEHFLMLSNIFVQNENIGLLQRKIILECMVPNFVIKDEFVRSLVLWFFSNQIADPEASAYLLDWMRALLEHDLMEKSYLESFYGQLATCFYSECLVQPLSKLMMNITNERTVNERVSFLIQDIYQQYENPAFKILLHELRKYNPRIDVKFTSRPNWKVPITNFEKALIKRARKLGISGSSCKDDVDLPVKADLFPEPEYFEACPPTHKRLTSITSVSELGRTARTLTLQLPSNPVSLLGSEIGMIYLEIFGPNEKFMGGLKSLLKPNMSPLVLSRICELQNRLRHGFPVVTHYLGEYVLLWDGVEGQNYVFDLIKWVHFDTLDELSSYVLIPISRLYTCGNVELKVGILESLINLLINMVTVHVERLKLNVDKFNNIVARPKWLDEPVHTFNKLCAFVQSLIISGLTMEGVDSPSLLLQALKFFDTTITLQFKLNEPSIGPPCPTVIYACLTSVCHVVLSQVGSLLVRYKQKVIPFLVSHGMNNEFDDDIQLIDEIVTRVYSYLWDGQDLLNDHLSSPLTNKNNIRSQPGVHLLTKCLSKKLNLNVKKMNNSDFITMLSLYCEGMEEFRKYMAEEIENA